jgi:hypothetical protein
LLHIPTKKIIVPGAVRQFHRPWEWMDEFEPESAGNNISFQMVTIAPLARLAHCARRRNLIALTSEWKITEARNPLLLL